MVLRLIGVAVVVRLLTAIVEYAAEAAYLRMLRAPSR